MKKSLAAIIGTLISPLCLIAGELTMTGTGNVSLPADNAYVSLSVVTEAIKPADALAMNSDATNRVFSSLDKLGIKKNEIKTNSLSLTPKYVYQDKQEPRITGYTATHNLRIVVCKVADTGKVLDAVVKDGANRIEGVTFDVSEEKRAEALILARKKAAQAAVDKATLYCDVLGIEKGDLKTLTEFTTTPSKAYYANAMSATPAPAPTNVEGGEIQVSVTVTIVWATK